jgi:hypothetical protein
MSGTGSDDIRLQFQEGDGPTGPWEADAAAEGPLGPDALTLAELADQLERDPEESWSASQALESIDMETRIRIIDGLGRVSAGIGVTNLLRHLMTSDDAATHKAAVQALAQFRDGRPGLEEQTDAPPRDRLELRRYDCREIVRVERGPPLLQSSLVTPVDGSGRGSIAVSATQNSERRTAVFLCDVEHGVTAVVGQIEAEGPGAGKLLEDVLVQSREMGVVDAPDLALGLLSGSLTLTDAAVERLVRAWLDQTLGGGFEPRVLPPQSADSDTRRPPSAALLDHAADILEACPSWLDDSPLTYELAEEILLREGRTAADPRRDSGAFRFMFQHRLIGRLELYRRMLLWMAWYWTYGGEPELARSAQILVAELSDEQYVVPSHPFAVVLMARSLESAGARLGTEADPRSARRSRQAWRSE